jgi:hypothetical protein
MRTRDVFIILLVGVLLFIVVWPQVQSMRTSADVEMRYSLETNAWRVAQAYLSYLQAHGEPPASLKELAGDPSQAALTNELAVLVARSDTNTTWWAYAIHPCPPVKAWQRRPPLYRDSYGQSRPSERIVIMLDGTVKYVRESDFEGFLKSGTSLSGSSHVSRDGDPVRGATNGGG